MPHEILKISASDFQFDLLVADEAAKEEIKRQKEANNKMRLRGRK